MPRHPAMLLAVATMLLAAQVAFAGPPPYPPYPPPPPPPPPRVYVPPPPPPPPPLSPAMRALYAPFYAAGLVLRYGVYYLFVAPIEVFSRAVTYGPEGGVERRRTREDDQ